MNCAIPRRSVSSRAVLKIENQKGKESKPSVIDRLGPSTHFSLNRSVQRGWAIITRRSI